MRLRRLISSVIVLCFLVVLAMNVKERVILATKDSVIEYDEPFDTFSVGVCITGEDDDTDHILRGFVDALEDYGTYNNYQFDINIAPSTENPMAVCRNYMRNGDKLIFSVGEEALSAALISTYDIPIVMADVINYSDYIYTDPQGEDIRNFTGVISLPNTEFLLSTLIEASTIIKGVALLYSTEDKNCIYQNELLENMLSQAGIPWKEYEYTVKTDDGDEEDSRGEDFVIVPRTPNAASSKEGANMEVESIGPNGILSGINEPESARAPRVSENWIGSKDYSDAADDIDTMEDVNEKAEDDTDEINLASFRDLVSLAATECSAIFIPKDSEVSIYADDIVAIATEHKAVTVSNDISIGVKTLCSTYTDPYDQGYRAGRQAYNILVNEKSIDEVPVSGTSWENSVKLYNEALAIEFGLSFPKSFRESTAFARNYIEGSRTVRLQLDGIP